MTPDITNEPGREGQWVVMLLENFPYPQDVRVRAEAEALARAGYRVTVVAPRAKGQPVHESIGNVDVERFRLPRERPGVLGLLSEYAVAHIAMLLRLARLLRRGAHIVHVHNPPDTMFLALELARRTGRRTVFDNHDLMTDLFAVRFGTGPALTLVRWAQKRAFLIPDLVITSNQSQANAAIAVGRRIAPIRVVRNGPPRRMLCGATAKVALTPTDRPFIVAYVGVLGQQDGVEALPAILARLRHEHRLDVELLVIGDGSERSNIETKAGDLSVANYLKVTGMIPHEEVAVELAKADVCVDVSPCNEFNDRCTMIKIGEYLAAGKPAVSFPLAETRFTAGDTVRYAAPNDLDDFARVVADLLNDPEARNELAGRGRLRAEALVWEHSERELLDAYEGLQRSYRRP